MNRESVDREEAGRHHADSIAAKSDSHQEELRDVCVHLRSTQASHISEKNVQLDGWPHDSLI
ncbi:hypothetical protein WH50_00285 [Pokkaliibacter plantistimulans]|uniref:Uncharacterized protein n=1 Tax=Pokkaliibacter plantistimulans TaxID=1635171 RepID=A0ABX5M8H3_9GAMM|nr:hypothetical protein [Pokkaliibacter plantistimulans]PXF33195.1 hypothetical protein WH50_00285 [Pokkaliibacter plantistimulans]